MIVSVYWFENVPTSAMNLQETLRPNTYEKNYIISIEKGKLNKAFAY